MLDVAKSENKGPDWSWETTDLLVTSLLLLLMLVLEVVVLRGPFFFLFFSFLQEISFFVMLAGLSGYLVVFLLLSRTRITHNA